MSAANSGFQSIVDAYNNFMETKSDPRTSDWFLVSSPGPLITILVTYLYFCISAGPRYMRDRKPYDLKSIIQVYNASQVIFSAYLVYLGLKGGWANGYSFTCQPVDYSRSPTAMTMASGVWLYYMTKIVELIDTVFFVLRKKSNQVTFLHLYHHTTMPICGWIGTRFLAGGHGTLLGVINSFIHIIMYSYYLLASLGPQYQKYLWWKKHLTAMQMIQFCIVFVHSGQLLIRDCNYPTTIAFLLSAEALVFLYMFGSFYHRSYVKSKKLEQTKNEACVNGDAEKPEENDNNNIKNGKIKAN